MTREEAIAILEVSKHMATSGRMYNQAIDMAIEALSEPTCKKCTDLISRADAMGAVQDHFNADGFKGYDDGQKMMDRIKALPSVEAEPTVIRSKTLMPTKDFKEWAKRVREENQNVIVIPCDAEVVPVETTATNTEKSSNCGGLISREAVINITAETGALETQRRVKQLPSADRPAGEWEEMEILCNPYPPLFCVECSECGYRVGRETYLDLENTFNFCPNCGAYMRNQNNEQR